MKETRLYLRTFIGLVLVIGLAVLFLGRPEVAPSDILQASSYNPAPAGNMAFYRTLKQSGWPVGRWQEDYPKLAGTDEVMLLARSALARNTAISSAETDRLVDWVRRGNRLVLLGDFTTSEDTRALLEKLGLNVPAISPPSMSFLEHSTELLGAGRERITLSGPLGECVSAAAYPLPNLPEAASVKLSQDGLPYAASLPLGGGDVWFVASASLIDNEFLPLGNNVHFALQLLQINGLPAQKIWFEEAHHGYRSSYAISGLIREPGLTLALAQMVLGLLVFILSQFYRFGQVLPLPQEQDRSSLDFVRSMGQLYRRADLRDDIVEEIYKDTRARAIVQLNLPPGASNDLIARRLRKLYPHLPDWKKLADRYDSDKFVQGLPPGGWLELAQDLTQIKRELL